MNIKEALREARETYISAMYLGASYEIDDTDKDCITRLAATIFIQGNRSGGMTQETKSDAPATSKQVYYFESLMNAATEQQLTEIQTELKHMGYEGIPSAKDILRDDISQLIDMLASNKGG